MAHRLGHTNRWLWRLHGVHHVPQKVNVANNGVNHVADIVVAQGAVQLTLALVGFSPESVLAASLFTAAQGYFVHANIDVHIGLAQPRPGQPGTAPPAPQHRPGRGGPLRLRPLPVGPPLRQLHLVPRPRAAAVGLHDPTSFPATGEILASLLHPLHRAKRRQPSA
ncbi:sterol desaturase family protein [Actinomadura keratinilytica]